MEITEEQQPQQQQQQPQQQQQQPQLIKVDGRYFYNSKDLQVFKPEFYYGCTTKPRNIITKKGIPNWEYIYATYEKALTRWNKSTESCKKAQLLISKQWVDENYFKSSSTLDKNKKVIIKKQILQQPQAQQFTTPPPPQREAEALAAIDEEEKEPEGHEELENAPPVLHLDDSEKFHDADGNVIEIETRGERDRKKIYFNVKDVSAGFEMPSLSKNLLRHIYLDVQNGYERGVHYKPFKRVPSGDTNQKSNTSLYLTYLGLVRVLMVSRNKNVNKFQDWAEKLFTIQFDYEDEEEKVLKENGNGHQDQQQQHEDVENAPPILHLEDSEKFHDADGNVIEIETRGERHEDKIYFTVKDVSVGFEMPNLNETLLHKEKGYTRSVDYKVMFNRSALTNGKCSTIKKCLFLTYEGLLRVLFVSRNKNATLFRKWATNKLFTIQMGTKDQKVKLGAEILNTSPRTLKAVLDKHAATFPSIYLMSLGKVRDLRETFGIPSDKPDDSTVYKFGFTEDLSRRSIELENQYSKIKGVTVTMGTFHVIDTKYTAEAENKVRELCGAFEVRINKTMQGFNELVVLDDKQFAIMRDLYSKYGENFAGATLALQKQIAELKDDLKERDNEIARLNMTIQHKDELHETEVQCYKKDIEIWKLKHQLETMSNATASK
jgi:hypothetical protein